MFDPGKCVNYSQSDTVWFYLITLLHRTIPGNLRKAAVDAFQDRSTTNTSTDTTSVTASAQLERTISVDTNNDNFAAQQHCAQARTHTQANEPQDSSQMELQSDEEFTPRGWIRKKAKRLKKAENAQKLIPGRPRGRKGWEDMPLNALSVFRVNLAALR